MCVPNDTCKMVGGNNSFYGEGQLDIRIVNVSWKNKLERIKNFSCFLRLSFLQPVKASNFTTGTNESITIAATSGIPLSNKKMRLLA